MTVQMNAPANIAAADTAAQSLLARCKDKQWKLLQQFACLEIALQRHLPDPPKTFGAKIHAWIKEDNADKTYERLIPARNLLAHAAIHCVRSGSLTYALWEVADSTSDLNCAKFDDEALTMWTKDLARLLDEAIAKASA